MCRVIEWAMAMLLVFLSYSDWKTKKVSVLPLGLTMVLSMIACIFVDSVSVWQILGGLLIGLLFLGISKLTKEAVGYGDSWLILSLGIYVGATRLLEILCVASFLASIFSILYCMWHGWSKKHTLPYIPFITIAYLGGRIL